MGPAVRFLFIVVDLSLRCPEESQMMKVYFVPMAHAACCEYRIISDHVPNSFRTKCNLFSIEKQAHLDDLRRTEKSHTLAF